MIKNVDILIDGQWGSTGKGNVISRIATDYTCFVRTGGPNAGHKVVLPSGKVVTYRHIPSGAMHNTDADLVLGPGAVINPKVLFEEMETIGVHPHRVFIDPQAIVIDDEDIAFEKKNFATMGSTCNGVGSATIRKIMRIANPRNLLARDCAELDHMLRPSLDIYSRHERGQILVEETQGTLLSLHHGEWPYVTARDTSATGQLSDAGLPVTRVRKVIMVVRTFPIRVKNPGVEDIGVDGGYSGPMGKELSWEEVSKHSGIPVETLTTNELTSCTKRLRRVAEFDDQLFLKACALNGPTDLAVTFADYYQDKAEFWKFAKHLEDVSGVPVSYVSWGFGADKVEVVDEIKESVIQGNDLFLNKNPSPFGKDE